MAAVHVAASRQQATAAAGRRPAVVIWTLLGLTAAVSFATLGLGAVRVPQPHAIGALFGHGTTDQIKVVREFELPRILAAWLVGGALAISGTVIQGVIRNPLASPDIVGVSKGAGLGALVLLLVYPQAAVSYLPAAAFVGGIAAMIIVYLVAYRRGTTPVRLALVGIAVAALGQTVMQYLLIRNQDGVATALVWLTGSLAGVDMSAVYQILPWIGVLVPLVVFFALRLDLLGLGDDLAHGLGVRVERTRRIALFLAVVLASSTVAIAGTIGFVGLIAPHMARRVVGSRHVVLLPTSALFGALLVVVADAIGRGAHPPIELPAGMITAFIGAPYFLYLLSRSL